VASPSEFNVEEIDLLQDAVAGEIARLLIRGVARSEQAKRRYEAYIRLGRKIGMQL